jgi:hypothetical protein
MVGEARRCGVSASSFPFGLDPTWRSMSAAQVTEMVNERYARVRHLGEACEHPALRPYLAAMPAPRLR